MKPVKLHLKNIGPFLDETIDFTQLKNMFLITGKTGSGKTTIFDAITFALYGSASGRNETFKLKSDYAANEEEAFVDYEFILNSCKYRVVRNIGVTYTGRDGTIKNKQNTMEFYAWDNSKQQYQMFPGKVAELTAKVTELIGLSKDEFTKIVVLPQGAFQSFLKSTSDKKSETLKKLFPIELYSEICRKSWEMAKDVKQKITIKEKLLEEAENDFNVQEKQKELSELHKQSDNLKKEKNQIQEELQKLASQKENINQKISLAQKAARLVELKKQLESDLEEHKLIKEKAENAERAMEVILYSDSLVELSKKQAETEKLLESKNKIKNQLEKESKEIELKSQEIEKLRQNIEIQKEKKSKVDFAQTLLTKKKTDEQNLENSKIQLIKNATVLDSLFTKSLDIVENNGAIIETLSQQKNEWENQLEDLEHQKELNLITNTAATLSATLKNNEPCPVCGSLTHPQKAKYEEKKNFEQLIKEIQIKIEQTEKNIDRAVKEIQNIKDTNKNAEEILTKARNFADKKSFNQQIEFSTGIYTQKIMDFSALISDFSNKQKIAEDSRESYSKIAEEFEFTENLLELNKQLEDSINNDSKLLLEFDLKSKEIYQNLTKVSVEVEENKKSLALIKEDIFTLEQKINESLLQNNFKNSEEAQQYKMERSQIEFYKQKAQKFFTSYDEVKVQIQTIEISPEDLEKHTAELNIILEKEKQTETKLKQLDLEIAESSGKMEVIYFKLQNILKQKNELQELQDNNQDVLRLDMDLNGSNSKKITFDSWLMGTFLDEVIEKANIRFKHISGKRYQFVLVTDKEGGRGKKGLDLEIMDTWTGKKRQTESLSGGETFEASISLALALTDVVQEKSGGVRLDSLFIDEGFGTLDSEVIYKAINILDQIREERTVGIISHVDLLEKEIKSHINVTSSLQGPSKITIENL